MLPITGTRLPADHLLLHSGACTRQGLRHPQPRRRRAQLLPAVCRSEADITRRHSPTRQWPASSPKLTSAPSAAAAAAASTLSPPQAMAVATAPTTDRVMSYSGYDRMAHDVEKPVLVEFFTQWCGPCALMGRVLSDLTMRMGGQLRVVKLDTEQYPQLASRYAVKALPTSILFRNGEPVWRMEGVVAEETLRKRLKYELMHTPPLPRGNAAPVEASTPVLPRTRSRAPRDYTSR